MKEVEFRIATPIVTSPDNKLATNVSSGILAWTYIGLWILASRRRKSRTYVDSCTRWAGRPGNDEDEAGLPAGCTEFACLLTVTVSLRTIQSQNRTALKKCTHLYDETQTQALSTDSLRRV